MLEHAVVIVTALPVAVELDGPAPDAVELDGPAPVELENLVSFLSHSAVWCLPSHLLQFLTEVQSLFSCFWPKQFVHLMSSAIMALLSFKFFHIALANGLRCRRCMACCTLLLLFCKK